MITTIPELFLARSQENPSSVIQYSKDADGKFHPTTYGKLRIEVEKAVEILSQFGVGKGDKVLLLSDNRKEWLIADLAILFLGAADVPRGRDATEGEIEYIYKTVKPKVVIVENEMLYQKLVNTGLKDDIKTLIMFDEPTEDGVISFNKKLDEIKETKELENPSIDANDVATIIFTSGTTGNPKGVMLTHNSLIFQVKRIHSVAPFQKDQIWLSVLPVWHAFERILQYQAIFETTAIAYSKPIGKIMLTDITRINPHYLGSVPRIWETIKEGVDQTLKNKSKLTRSLFNGTLYLSKRYCFYRRIIRGLVPNYTGKKQPKLFAYLPYFLLKPFYAFGQKVVFKQVKTKLGKNYVGGVSGGGSLSKDIDEYFEALGIVLINGYGLTETGPVIGTGLFQGSVKNNMLPLSNTEIKIVDDDGKELPPGVKGELLIRGEQIMLGYYENEEMTKAIIDKDGFLHTGDLATRTYDNWFQIVGRKKDTIVLKGGENIEPTPIENKLILSEYIQSAVVVGQDQKYLSALIVPNYKNVELYLKNNGISYMSRDSIHQMREVKALIVREVSSLVNSKEGFKSFEQIINIAILKNPFEVGRELSAKQEVKRAEINKIYEQEIKSLF